MTRFGAMRRLATGGCLPGRSPCAGFTAPRRGRSTARPLSARRKPAPVLPPPWSPREVIKDRATAGPGGLSGATALRLPLRRPRRCTHATACRPGTHQNLGALGTSAHMRTSERSGRRHTSEPRSARDVGFKFKVCWVEGPPGMASRFCAGRPLEQALHTACSVVGVVCGRGRHMPAGSPSCWGARRRWTVRCCWWRRHCPVARCWPTA